MQGIDSLTFTAVMFIFFLCFSFSFSILSVFLFNYGINCRLSPRDDHPHGWGSLDDRGISTCQSGELAGLRPRETQEPEIGEGGRDQVQGGGVDRNCPDRLEGIPVPLPGRRGVRV